jgi:hypothetical protein
MRTRLLFLLSGLFIAGCGGVDVPDTGKVAGSVTIDGKPAAGIRVKFTPAEKGRASSATTDEAGNYTLVYSANAMGALIGKHKVTIAAQEISADVPDASAKGKRVENTTVPAKYVAMSKDVEVKAGDNTIDLTYP